MKTGIKESTLKTGQIVNLDVPTGRWLIHNQEVLLQETCYICGTTEGHDYKDHKCWLCWRNLNPGALASP